MSGWSFRINFRRSEKHLINKFDKIYNFSNKTRDQKGNTPELESLFQTVLSLASHASYAILIEIKSFSAPSVLESEEKADNGQMELPYHQTETPTKSAKSACWYLLFDVLRQLADHLSKFPIGPLQAHGHHLFVIPPPEPVIAVKTFPLMVQPQINRLNIRIIFILVYSSAQF